MKPTLHISHEVIVHRRNVRCAADALMLAVVVFLEATTPNTSLLAAAEYISAGELQIVVHTLRYVK